MPKRQKLLWLLFFALVACAPDVPRVSPAASRAGTAVPNENYAAAVYALESQARNPVLITIEERAPLESVDNASSLARKASGAVERFLGRVAKDDPKLYARIHINHRYKHLPILSVLLTDEDSKLLSKKYKVRVVRDELVTSSLGQWTSMLNAEYPWYRGYDAFGTTIAIIDQGFTPENNLALLSQYDDKVAGEACYNSASNGPLGIASCCGRNRVRDGDLVSAFGKGSSQRIFGEKLTGPDGATFGCGHAPGRQLPDFDHGTLVSIIAAGRDFRDTDKPGVWPFRGTGIARGARILNLSVFETVYLRYALCDGESACSRATHGNILRAIDHVIQEAARLNIASANMSFGSGRFSGNCDDDVPHFDLAFRLLRQVNVAPIVSVGNEGLTGEINSPACVSSAIAVGATDSKFKLASFSNISPTVDFLAPGKDIVIRKRSYSGTTFAAPFVAGAFAVIRQSNPGLSVEDAELLLKSTARTIRTDRGQLSMPFVDLEAALVTSPSDGLSPARYMASWPGTQETGYDGNEWGTLRFTVPAGAPVPPAQTFSIQNTSAAPIRVRITTLGSVEWLKGLASPVEQTLVPGALWSVRLEVDKQITSKFAPCTFRLGLLRAEIVSSPSKPTMRGLEYAHSPDICGGAPPYVTFAGASRIEGTSVTSIATNSYHICAEQGEPLHAGIANGSSLWWRWTAPSADEVLISTEGSNFDTILGVYELQGGAAITNLEEKVSNDDSSRGVASEVRFVPEVGKEYFIAAASFSESPTICGPRTGGYGPVVLMVSQP